jgi:hypothetical protein
MTSCLLVVETFDDPESSSSRSAFADLDVGLLALLQKIVGKIPTG